MRCTRPWRSPESSEAPTAGIRGRRSPITWLPARTLWTCTAFSAPGALPHAVFITTRQGPFIGPDRGGGEWLPVDFGQFSEITYTRDLKAAPHDPNMFYVSIGAAARSKHGALFRSRDLFKTFERVDQGIAANSTMMAVAVDRERPAHLACASRDGQVFASWDDGATWSTHSLPEKAREVRALAAG